MDISCLELRSLLMECRPMCICVLCCYLIRPLKGLSFLTCFDIYFFCSRDYESLKKEDVFQNNHLVRSLGPIGLHRVYSFK